MLESLDSLSLQDGLDELCINEQPASILDCPQDVLFEIIALLPITDAVNLSLTCREMHRSCTDDERIWRPRCLARFASKTDPTLWIARARTHLAESAAAAAAAESNTNGPASPLLNCSPGSRRTRARDASASGSIPMPSLLGGPFAREASGSQPLPRTRPPEGGLSHAFARPPRGQGGPSGPSGAAAAPLHLARTGSGPSVAPLAPPSLLPSSYFRLFKLLSDWEGLEGVWKCANDPKGSLISITFTPDGLEGSQWTGNELQWRLRRAPFCWLGPDRCTHAPLVTSASSIVLKDALRALPSLSPSPFSHASHAATLTALLSSSAPGPFFSESVLGSSPGGSFEYELQRFMQGSIQRRSSASRQRQGSPNGHPARKGSQQGAWAGGLHLTRVVFPPEAPVPWPSPVARDTAAAAPESLSGHDGHASYAPHFHALEGVFKGVYGPHGLEVIQIGLVSEGAASLGPGFEDLAPGPVLVATKVTGDHNVPAGERTFLFEAAPMTCLSEDFTNSMEDIRFHHDVSDLDASDSGDDEGPGAAVRTSTESEGEDGSAGLGAQEVAEDPASIPGIVSVHKGMGQVALTGHVSSRFVPGFFLSFSNNEFGFVWGESYNFLVNFRRIRQKDLMAPGPSTRPGSGTTGTIGAPR